MPEIGPVDSMLPPVDKRFVVRVASAPAMVTSPPVATLTAPLSAVSTPVETVVVPEISTDPPESAPDVTEVPAFRSIAPVVVIAWVEMAWSAVKAAFAA